jgi:methyltransferase (TIGR00027 family)
MRLTEGKPSATAQRVAMRRAAHQILDTPRVFEDPLAMAIIGREAAAQITAGTAAGDGFSGRFMRAFLAARSRFAEDELRRSYERGTRQYVILGAGLDTFAYRNPFLDLAVFEIDHPATQAWKRWRLEEAGMTIPANVTYAPVDFQTETFIDALARVGFRANEAAFFSWLGVTMYLKETVVMETVRTIISLSPKNGIVFDYSVPRSSLSFLNKMAFDALTRRVTAVGEPFIGFFEPSELASSLKNFGYNEIENLGADEINQRYFAGRTDKLKVGGKLARLMSARG